jgi:predicted CxxxxCH...CXXCH cytochrome family protein
VSVLPALALAGSLVLGLPDGHAVQKYQYSPQLCTDCHGMPPSDSNVTFRNVTTGAVRGNHLTHATSIRSSCEKCHNGSKTFTTDHSDGFIHMSSNINASPSPSKGVYSSKGVFFNQTSNPILGTCTNVNCHFETTTPVWSSATFTSPADCGQCHGAPPSGTNPGYAGGIAGNHGKHNLYYSGASQCVKCHTDHTAEANTFAHATSQRNIVVAPRDPASTLAGSYSGSGANFLPSLQASQSFGNCSATYCHSNGQSNSGPYSHTAILWGSSTTCTSCHDGAAAITTLSGKHQKHIGTSVYAFTCNYCHYDTTNNGSTISSYALHVNKTKDVTFDPAIRTSTSSWNGSQCVNIYCHGNGQSLTPTDTVAWADTIGCSSCHAYPSLTSGSHAKHIVGTSSCNKCHNATVTANVGEFNSIALHVNRSVDIMLNAGFSEKVPRYNGYSMSTNHGKAAGSGFARCTTLYCHSDGKRSATYVAYSSKKWGGGSLGCNGCHGTGTATGAPGYTSGAGYENSHSKHVAGSADCVKCHFKTTTTGTSIPGGPMPGTGSAHLNGTPDVNLSKPYTYAAYSGVYNSAAKTCSATYCHGSTNTTPAWGSSTQCNSCHNARNNDAYWAANSAHRIHWESSALPSGYANYSGNVSSATAYRFTCSSCHSQQGGAAHVNGPKDANYAAEVFFGYTAPGRVGAYVYGTTQGSTDSGLKWTDGGGGCNTSYCHSKGDGTVGYDPQVDGWVRTTNSAASVDRCKACHGYTTASGTLITTGRHEKHVKSSTYGFSCARCHNATTTDGATIVDKSRHANKAKNIDWDSTISDGTGYVNAATACSNIYCHSNGTSTGSPYGAPATAVRWDTATPLFCDGCHGTATSDTLSGKHQKHLNNAAVFGTANSLGCVACHARTVSDNSTVSNYGKHLNKFKDYSGVRAGSYNAGTKVCSSVYCHSSGQATPNYRTVAAWDSATTYDCKGCHGADAAFGSVAGEPNYTNTGAGTANANSHEQHVSGFGITDTTGCSRCHYRTVDAQTQNKLRNYSTLHQNGSRDIAIQLIGGKTGTYNSGTMTCVVTYCHGAASSPAWGVTSINCNDCHSAKADDAYWSANSAHKLHWQGTDLPASYAATPGNITGDATTYRFACSSCHSAVKGAVHANGPPNANGSAEVFFGYTSANRKGSYSYGTTQGTTDNDFSWTDGGTGCNTSYCHSDGQGGSGSAVTWTTTANSGCTVCHGNATSNTLSGKHQNHVNNAAVIGTNFGCVDCHAKTVSNDTTLSNKVNHVNKFKDYSGVKAGGSSSYSSGSCSGSYCHSSGKKGTVASSVEPSAPVWTSGSLACKGCHGAKKPAFSAFSSIAGEPNYANTGGAGSITANSHQKHVTVGASDCVKCHFKTTSNGTAIISGSTRHLDRTVDVNLSKRSTYTTYSGAYNGSARTCSATYCHGGTNTTPAWGGTTSCNTCHNARANDANWTTTGAHKIHWEGTDLPTSYTMTPGNGSGDATTYRFACSSCHDPSAGAVHADTPVNANRAAQVFFGYSTIGVKGSYTDAGATANNDNGFNWTNGTTGCTSTYCHSNGEGQAGNTAVAWGTSSKTGYNCNFCHGNTRAPNNDWRRGAPLYTSGGNSYKGSPKGNAHDRHINVKAVLPATYMQCYNCHAATTQNNTSIVDKTKHLSKAYNIVSVVQGLFSSSFRDGDDTSNSTKVTVTYSYSPAGSSCSNVSCHPVAADLTQSPPQPKTRDTSSVKWNGNYLCVDCHNIAMEDTSTFHHAMRNYSSTYPTQSPYSSALVGQNATSRRCTMCHVDHNIFSPDLNSSSGGRSYNLRTDIAVSPTSSSGYTNSDYVNSGTGGICISCHTNAKRKDTNFRRHDEGANYTPQITIANYSASSHEYMVSAKFMSDNSVVNGNCSKCHNALLGETSVFANATSAYQFGNHNSGVRRLQGAMDAAGGETAEEQICYRCHSHSTDADPGGGPPKAVDGKDFYGVATMSAASEGIFQANSYFRTANPTTSTTNKLFFKPTGAESPSENMPNPTTNDTDLGDTFAGGTYIVRSMSPWTTTTSYNPGGIKSQPTDQTGTKYWRMAKFVSPVIASNTTVPAGTWTINIYSRESSTSQNAYIRYMVYKWNVGGADSKGATIIAKGTYATELATTAAPGVNRQIGISVPETTFSANEKIVVDLAIETRTGSTTSYTASFYFGAGAPSNLTLPGNVTFTYADPGSPGFGHGPAGYFGVHKPSTTDETLTTIAQNRHVECNDCHNPHSATNGLADDYGTATAGGSNYLDNTIKRWVTNQWTGKTIAILSGTGSGQTRTISSNTATRVTVSSSWTTNPNSTSVYKIIGNTNLVGGVMRNVPGASVSYTANQNWSASNPTYTLVNSSTYEYNVCFKCHAKTSATENTLKYWNVTSASLQAKRWTDIGLEFNPNNQSYHPVVSTLPASDPSATYGSSRLAAAQLINGWAPGMTMSCTDCHDSSSATSGSRGPHGSSVKWMLSGPNRAWPYQGAASNGETTGTLWTLSNRATGAGTADGLFCLNCHPSTNQNNVHSTGNHSSYTCTECHIRVPHGGKVSRLISAKSSAAALPSRYWPNGNGGGTTRMVRFNKTTPNSYGESNCNASCYGGHSAGSGEQW